MSAVDRIGACALYALLLATFITAVIVLPHHRTVTTHASAAGTAASNPRIASIPGQNANVQP